ncbi:MAG: hypothetical protein ACE149_06720 [Armatimonadota bacterium]
MAAANATVTWMLDLLLRPFGTSRWAGLVFVSLITGAVLLVIFRYTSNQRAIRATKDRILAHLLEVVLYRDQMRVVMRAQARLALDNLRYLGYAMVPLACMILPVGLLLAQLDLRYGHRPLRVGESAVVAVKLRPGADLDGVAISARDGVEVETESLRIPTLSEVDWRVRATSSGEHEIRISAGGEEFGKGIVAGRGAGRVTVARVGGGLLAQFLHPGEPPLPASGPVESVAVSYPDADLRLLGRTVHWIWPWLVISMLFGYALKGPLRVQV